MNDQATSGGLLKGADTCRQVRLLGPSSGHPATVQSMGFNLPVSIEIESERGSRQRGSLFGLKIAQVDVYWRRTRQLKLFSRLELWYMRILAVHCILIVHTWLLVGILQNTSVV